jgi:DNA-binding NarL/FixJ family response regulator
VQSQIKVVVVAADDEFRQRLCALLESAGGITVVGEVPKIRRAAGAIREVHPDVVLLDMGTGGLQVVTQTRALFPHARIIVLNEGGQERMVLDAFRRGALGHLVKGKFQPSEIVAAVRVVHRGQVVLSPDVAGRMLDEVARAAPRARSQSDRSR